MRSNPIRPSDKQIIEDIRAGGVAQERALLWFTEDIVVKGFLTGFVRRYPLTREDAEYLIERTAVIFLRKITDKSFVPKSSLRTYFIGIAKGEYPNLYRMRLRSGKNESPLPYDPEALLQDPAMRTDTSVEPEETRQEQWEYIINNHVKIREICKKIIIMDLQGHTNDEIQAATGVTDVYRERYRCTNQFLQFARDHRDLFKDFLN